MCNVNGTSSGDLGGLTPKVVQEITGTFPASCRMGAEFLSTIPCHGAEPEPESAAALACGPLRPRLHRQLFWGGSSSVSSSSSPQSGESKG
jgi:hypothetical protein